jgi:hypothetical protein
MRQIGVAIILKSDNNKNITTMKSIIKFLCCVLIGAYSVSCQFSNNKRDNSPHIFQKVIDITCDSCVLFIRPTTEQIEQMKSNYQDEEYFYAMTDDMSFYTVTAIEYLEDKSITVFYLDTIKTVLFNGKDLFDFSQLAWDFVLYKKNEAPKIVPAIDLIYEFEKYFNLHAEP